MGSNPTPRTSEGASFCQEIREAFETNLFDPLLSTKKPIQLMGTWMGLQTEYEKTEVPEETVRKLWEAWNRHDLDATAALFSPEAIIHTTHTPSAPEPLKSGEDYRKLAQAFLKAFPDARVRSVTLLSK